MAQKGEGTRADAAKGEVEFGFSEALDREAIRVAFARLQRVHIPDVLPMPLAARIHHSLMTEVPYMASYRASDGSGAFTPAEWAALGPEGQARLTERVMTTARDGFAYWYDVYSVSKGVQARQNVGLFIHRVHDFLNSPPCLDFIRGITGIEEIRSADVKATRYRPGSFLTMHTDEDEEKDRLVAFVFNFSPGWLPDHGGILSFYAPEGQMLGAYLPKFNALNLFQVPKLHSVSIVAPFAKGARYSLTGWFRRAAPGAMAP